MGNVKGSTPFSIAKDGKYHDATFRVEGDVVTVLYWGPQGVTRREAHTDNTEQPQQMACMMLEQMIQQMS